jgi:16S rRNA processing protein RimM
MTQSAAALRVARIDAVHGLRGELSARILTDFPERLLARSEIRVGRQAGAAVLMQVMGARPHRGKILLRLAGIEGVDAARKLVGSDVWIDATEVAVLPADAYFHRDLLGLRVIDTGDRVIGEVQDILRTGGADVLVVRREGVEVLIPAAKSICIKVDLAARTLIVDPPPGLLEINAV